MIDRRDCQEEYPELGEASRRFPRPAVACDAWPGVLRPRNRCRPLEDLVAT